MTVELRHYTDIHDAWQAIIDVYAEVRAPVLHQPHYSVTRFGERLARHGAEPGWEAVVAWDAGEAAAFIYANALAGPDDRWWLRMNELPQPEVANVSTVAVKELMVRQRWRKTGLSAQLHDSLLSDRPEQQSTLMVNPEAGDGKVMAIYTGWDYQPVSRVQPSPDSPPLVAMIRPVRISVAELPQA